MTICCRALAKFHNKVWAKSFKTARDTHVGSQYLLEWLKKRRQVPLCNAITYVRLSYNVWIAVEFLHRIKPRIDV
jgi:hypothetical protein